MNKDYTFESRTEMRISRHLKKIGINTQNSTPKHNLPVK